MSKNSFKPGAPGGVNKTGTFSIPDAQTIAGTTDAASFANNVIVTSGSFTSQIRNGLTNATHKSLFIWDSTKGKARKILHVMTDDRVIIDKPFEKQVIDFTPVVNDTGTSFTITMPDTSSINFITTGNLVSEATAGLTAAWLAEAIATPSGDFAKYTAVDATTKVTATANDYDMFVDTSSIAATASGGAGSGTPLLTKSVSEDGAITTGIAAQVIKNTQYRKVSVLAEDGTITMFDELSITESTSVDFETDAGLYPIYGNAAANNATITFKS